MTSTTNQCYMNEPIYYILVKSPALTMPKALSNYNSVYFANFLGCMFGIVRSAWGIYSLCENTSTYKI